MEAMSYVIELMRAESIREIDEATHKAHAAIEALSFEKLHSLHNEVSSRLPAENSGAPMESMRRPIRDNPQA